MARHAAPARLLAMFLCAIVGAACEQPSDDGSDESSDGGSPDGAEADFTGTWGAIRTPAVGAVAERTPLVLPLEVLGAPPAEVELVLTLEAGDRAFGEGLSLALSIHDVVAPDSATLTINDEAPLDLFVAFGREGGDVATAVVDLPASALVAGDNRLTFAYARQLDGISGFRVVALEARAGAETHAVERIGVPPSVAISNDPEAIERGRRYFQEESRDGGPVCARCHVRDGADLAYFDFSSFSIVARAELHRFERPEAEDIASYLASLDVPHEGSVFDPPFQPGEGSVGAAGAGFRAVLSDDATFASSLGGVPALDHAPPWDWAAGVDTYRAPTAVALPTWFRWLPRELDPTWFDEELLARETELEEAPSVETARAFEASAVRRGKELMILHGDHHARVDLLRFAAVKLWNVSRGFGFDADHHGFPTGMPAYPYEVGFALFEALREGRTIEGGADRVLAWWWLQLVVDPGRGLSDGTRPLDWRDVGEAADRAGAGLAQRGFLHLLGSWEESRGTLAERWGTAEGPVRLLEGMMMATPGALRAAVLERFLRREAQHLDEGGELDQGHHVALSTAWARGCDALTEDARAALRGLAPAEVAADLDACL